MESRRAGLKNSGIGRVSGKLGVVDRSRTCIVDFCHGPRNIDLNRQRSSLHTEILSKHTKPTWVYSNILDESTLRFFRQILKASVFGGMRRTRFYHFTNLYASLLCLHVIFGDPGNQLHIKLYLSHSSSAAAHLSDLLKFSKVSNGEKTKRLASTH